MTNFAYNNIWTKSIFEKDIKIKNPVIVYKFNIPQMFKLIPSEYIDNFEYPSLDDIRTQFEATGLYSKEKIDRIIEAYERLPKYRAHRHSAPRSRKRS